MTSTEIFNVKFGECSESLYNRYADNSSDLALREGKMTIEEFNDIRRNQKHFNRRYDAITGFERVFEEPKIDENWKRTHPTKYSDIEKMEIGTDKNIPVYIWLDENGDNEHFIMKLYSKAEKIYFPEDCTGMFKLLTKVKKIDLSSFDLSKVKNMKEMFKFCYSLEEINFGNFDLKNVTNIEEMFMYCIHLKKNNLSLEGIEKIAKKDFCFYNNNIAEKAHDFSHWDESAFLFLYVSIIVFMLYNNYMKGGILCLILSN